ncbi:MAG TPA: L-aspartate oxidase, partial [Actinomycetes bacterium]|nr:L-aspartate oxidase [Actinomycetes bacterium]
MIPRRLLDLDLGRLPTEEVDVLVAGSGVAGLSTALELPPDRSVLLVTKGRLAHSATRYAQGGIAAVLGSDDSPADHWADTMAAGAGLCDPGAVGVLVEEGAEAVRRLQRLGTRFDLEAGALARTLEGGHSRPRIVHAGGDATGAEVERALVEAVRGAAHVATAERTFLIDLVGEGSPGAWRRGPGGAADALTGAVLWAGGAARLVRAGAVVLASGGAGQLYASTTNPALSTGDGIAAALRAGAALADLEFVQFHPTALHLDSDPRPLISEAMRGEGAVLRDRDGDPVMDGVHPRADLAPRDVVTRGMAARMAALGVDHLYLDATRVPADLLERRFPTILARCRAAGIEPTREWIPVSPAAHYLMGGVLTDLDGRASLEGLYAVGEAACTGVHGANRLASNSLLEGLVFAARIARAIGGRAGDARPPAAPVPMAQALLGGPWGGAGSPPRGTGNRAETTSPNGSRLHSRRDLRALMTADAGVLRSADGLVRAAQRLAELASAPAPGPALASAPAPGSSPAAGGGDDRQRWETANLLQLGGLLARLALAREESRGTHHRREHPGPVDAWR